MIDAEPICPACGGNLQLEEDDTLTCREACGYVLPIEQLREQKRKENGVDQTCGWWIVGDVLLCEVERKRKKA